jgi:nucleotide-binding universal stress UspA family protein
MKRILIPTDFSLCSKVAVKTGMDWAAQSGAEVILLHDIDVQSHHEPNEDEIQNAIENAQLILDGMDKENENITIKKIISREGLFKSIPKILEEYTVDLMVMGSHGASGKNEFFIGSNTQKIARLVHCPILVIKEPLDKLDFDNVVFASTFNESEAAVFKKFLSLVKDFKPVIHLVAINTGSFFDAPVSLTIDAMESFKSIAAPLTCKVHMYKDFTVESGIRHFAKEIRADLIGISNHQRKPLKRMLTGSTVEAIINHAHVPVLSMDY